MTIKKSILATFIAAGLSFTINAPARAEFNTVSLVGSTLAQTYDCLGYQINGISLRLHLTPLPVLFWTVNISHNTPEYVTMTHRELGDMPWTEYNLLFEYAYGFVSNAIFKVPVNTIMGISSDFTMGGGQYEYQDYGDYQATNLYEAMIIGNPMSMLFDMFNWNGLMADSKIIYYGNDEDDYYIVPCKTHGCLEDSNPLVASLLNLEDENQTHAKPNLSADERKKQTQTEVIDWLNAWKDAPDSGNWGLSWPRSFTDFFSLKDVFEQFKEATQTIKEITQVIEKAKEAMASLGGSLGYSPFCPTAWDHAAPFWPFYLSGIDSHLWRWGYPITDAHKSKTILNPFSKDTVGGIFEEPLTGLSLPETWGHIFPRDGTVNHVNDAKASAVIAVRATNLLGEDEKPLGRLYWKPKWWFDVGAWAKIDPEVSGCHFNIANTGTVKQTQSQYSWNNWIDNTCDLDRRGKRILYIPLPTIHITPKIPQ